MTGDEPRGENHFDMVIRSLFILCLALLAMPSQAAVLGDLVRRPDAAVAATLGDLDGDGVPELVVAGPTGSRSTWELKHSASRSK